MQLLIAALGNPFKNFLKPVLRPAHSSLVEGDARQSLDLAIDLVLEGLVRLLG